MQQSHDKKIDRNLMSQHLINMSQEKKLKIYYENELKEFIKIKKIK
jgi:hypothetical protein